MLIHRLKIKITILGIEHSQSSGNIAKVFVDFEKSTELRAVETRTPCDDHEHGRDRETHSNKYIPISARQQIGIRAFDRSSKSRGNKN